MYVAGSLPGEVIRVRPTAKRGEGWAAGIDTVATPSPERAIPACQHFGTCGGCTLQHWRDEPYAAWKADLLADALKRAGYEDAPIAPMLRTAPGTRQHLVRGLRQFAQRVIDGDGLVLRLRFV